MATVSELVSLYPSGCLHFTSPCCRPLLLTGLLTLQLLPLCSQPGLQLGYLSGKGSLLSLQCRQASLQLHLLCALLLQACMPPIQTPEGQVA